MRHVAQSEFFETTPGGVLGERYTCSCGSSSTAAQMAGTPGGLACSALMGHHPCPGIITLHDSGEARIEIEV